MKIVVAAAFGVLAAAGVANAQPATADKAGQVCIEAHEIDHTHVVDPRTILYYMRDGKIWQNTLKAPCRGLEFHGYEDLVHEDEICSNAQSIRVLVTGQVCLLGAFTPYTPPPKTPTP